MSAYLLIWSSLTTLFTLALLYAANRGDKGLRIDADRDGVFESDLNFRE